MRWIAFTTLAAALLAVAAAAHAATAPALRTVRLQPLTVRGVNFEAHESVRVILSAGARMTRRAQASATGTFTVNFRVRIGPCRRFTVQAFGSEGSRARLVRTVLQPDCLPDDSTA